MPLKSSGHNGLLRSWRSRRKRTGIIASVAAVVFIPGFCPVDSCLIQDFCRNIHLEVPGEIIAFVEMARSLPAAKTIEASWGNMLAPLGPPRPLKECGAEIVCKNPKVVSAGKVDCSNPLTAYVRTNGSSIPVRDATTPQSLSVDGTPNTLIVQAAEQNIQGLITNVNNHLLQGVELDQFNDVYGGACISWEQVVCDTFDRAMYGAGLTKPVIDMGLNPTLLHFNDYFIKPIGHALDSLTQPLKPH